MVSWSIFHLPRIKLGGWINAHFMFQKFKYSGEIKDQRQPNLNWKIFCFKNQDQSAVIKTFSSKKLPKKLGCVWAAAVMPSPEQQIREQRWSLWYSLRWDLCPDPTLEGSCLYSHFTAESKRKMRFSLGEISLRHWAISIFFPYILWVLREICWYLPIGTLMMPVVLKVGSCSLERGKESVHQDPK